MGNKEITSLNQLTVTKPDLRATKKPRLVWTPELHARFEKAINKLSPDRANPKSIMILLAKTANPQFSNEWPRTSEIHVAPSPEVQTDAEAGRQPCQPCYSGCRGAGEQHPSGHQPHDAEQCSSGNVVAKAERTSGQTKVADQCNDVAKAERTSGLRGLL
eukprot:gene10860-16975_t